MGIKISNMTETGSAPTGSYIPIAYDGENYKVNPSSAITGLRYVEDWASTIGGVAVAHGATFTIRIHGLSFVGAQSGGWNRRNVVFGTD